MKIVRMKLVRVQQKKIRATTGFPFLICGKPEHI